MVKVNLRVEPLQISKLNEYCSINDGQISEMCIRGAANEKGVRTDNVSCDS